MKYPLDDEVKRLLKVLRDSKSGMRDRTLIELSLNTGLRLNELSGLNCSDVICYGEIKDRLVVRADIAKRSKERTIPLNQHTRDLLGDFVAWKKRRKEPLDPDTPLFRSKKGNRLSNRQIQDNVIAWYRKAGIGDHGYTVHSLRHRFAISLRQKGVKLETIQKLLGHASLQSTGVYLEASPEDLIEAVETLAA